MKFVEVLKRYHISPLKYEDNVFLSEKDYKDLFILLLRYYASVDGFEFLRSVLNNEEEKILFLKKNSLISIEPEETFDVLMGQNVNPVVNSGF